VNRWKAILSLLCLAVWLPATQHCKLENLPGLAFLQCAGDTPTNSDCGDGDQCDQVERGLYKSESTTLVLTPPAIVALFVAAELSEQFESSQILTIGAKVAPPPDLPTSWQFSSRTALPVRAPSFAS
jgi:hypothetical protein